MWDCPNSLGHKEMGKELFIRDDRALLRSDHVPHTL